MGISRQRLYDAALIKGHDAAGRAGRRIGLEHSQTAESV